jgi:hypothetical protein
MFTRTWIHRLFARTPRTRRPEPARFRPRLEALEGRLAPAVLKVNSTADNTTDTSVLTLREALAIVNTSPDVKTLSQSIQNQISGALHDGQTDTIQFDPTKVTAPITLGGTQLELSLPSTTATITIDGGAAGVTVDGNKASRIFLVDSGVHAALNDLTISNGKAATYGGGAIWNSGTLTVSNCTLSGNSGYFGGGIENDGTLTVSNSTLSGNSGTFGGGIYNDVTLTVSNSTLSGNTGGGAGGIFDSQGTLTMNNTIVANSNGKNIFNWLGKGTITGSHNLIGDGSGGSGLTNTITGDPKLGPLASNGGPTQTMALLSGSPAIDAGDSSLIPNDPNTGKPYTTDQRGAGFTRIVGSKVDIGAFEVQTTDSTVALTAGPGPSVYGQAVTLTAAVSLTLSGTQATAGTITFLDGSTVLKSGVAVSGGQATYSTAALTAGTHTLLAVYSGAPGFLPAAGAHSQVVNQRAVTLSGGRPYDGTPTAAASILSITNRVGNDLVTLSGSATLAGAGAGAETIWSFTGLQLGGTAKANYTLTGASGAVTISQAMPTVQVTDAGGTYSGNPYPATDAKVTGVGTDGVIASFGDASLSYTYYQGTTALGGAPTGAGSYTVVAHYAGSANYQPADSAPPVAFTIIPAPLTITAQDATIIQGQALPTTFGLSYSGWVNNEGPGVLGGTPTFTLTPTGPSTYAIQPGGLTASNYQIAFANGTLTVLSWSQATTNLLKQVNDAGLEQGIQNSLDSKLQAALDSFSQGNQTAAKNQLAAFLNEVSAQSGKKIDDALADALSASALEILNAVG